MLWLRLAGQRPSSLNASGLIGDGRSRPVAAGRADATDGCNAATAVVPPMLADWRVRPEADP